MRTLFVVLLQLMGYCTYTQFSLSYFAGASSADHGDLKSIQSDVGTNLVFQTFIVNDFEPSYHWSIRANYKFSKNEIGVYVLEKKTGGRIGAQDATGIYRFDQVLDLTSIGLVYKRFLTSSFAVGLRFGITSTDNQIEESLIVSTSNLINDTFLFKSTGIELNPLVSYQLNLIKYVALVAEVGYSLDSSSNFSFEGRETTIAPDWTGYRIELGLKLSLIK